jgi:hypothetical protein
MNPMSGWLPLLPLLLLLRGPAAASLPPVVDDGQAALLPGGSSSPSSGSLSPLGGLDDSGVVLAVAQKGSHATADTLNR